MAIATLAECYNNPRVFQGVVKIRKGVAVSLMMDASCMSNVYAVFDRYIHVISAKVSRCLIFKAVHGVCGSGGLNLL